MMRRPDETPPQPAWVDNAVDHEVDDELPRRSRPADDRRAPIAALDAGEPAPSKTRRKAAMHDLQALGEKLVGLSPARLQTLALPERLADAVADARGITRWEARRRQMQFIGRLMREIDPEPIRARLLQWAGAPDAEKARLAAVERWRARLIEEPDALDSLSAEIPAADRARLMALVAGIHKERATHQPPHAFRELFRVLNALLAAETR